MHTFKPTVDVVPYDPRWNHIFYREKILLQGVLQNVVAHIHHIGSTAVPGLWAKPIIDIIVELFPQPFPLKDALKTIGYTYKGEINIPLRRFFRKKVPHGVNLHVYFRGNPEVEQSLRFRNLLRRSPTDRFRYNAMKRRLVQDTTAHEMVHGLKKYTLAKHACITHMIKKTKFRGLCPRFCAHFSEWQAYSWLRHSNIFAETHDSIHCSDPTGTHWVIYRGTDIVGAIHIEHKTLQQCHITVFPGQIPKALFRSTYLLSFLSQWCHFHKKSLITYQWNTLPKQR